MRATAPKFLVTGADGMLGRAFLRQIPLAWPEAKILAAGKSLWDVSTRAPEEIAKSHFDYIVHCAAMTNADLCEIYPDVCRRIQVEGTRNVLEVADRCSARIIYPQSFLIYGENSDVVDESTDPNPLSFYGQFKLEAENLVRTNADHHLVVRMGGFFGGSEVDKNFVGKFTPHAFARFTDGPHEISVGNRTWQPTYTEDLAMNCLKLVEHEKTGLYCMAAKGSASFYDVACEIIESLGLSDRLRLKEIPAEEISRSEKARRPSRTVIENRRLRSENLDFQRDWKLALRCYLHESYFDRYRPKGVLS